MKEFWRLKRLVLCCFLTFALSACSPVIDDPEPPIATPSSLPEASETSLFETEGIESKNTDAETLDPSSLMTEDFSAIAIESCRLAMELGVEEVNTDASYRQLMIPKNEGIRGFSAVWEDMLTGEVGIIWESDVFLTCYPAATLSLASEAGEALDWEIRELEGTFIMYQDFGEFGSETIQFHVSNGVFSAVHVHEGEKFLLNYGPDLNVSVELIQLAVEQWEG